MINGVKEAPAEKPSQSCVLLIGPIWKLDGEICGCHLPANHLDNPLSAQSGRVRWPAYHQWTDTRRRHERA